jgi:endo-1,4-beta-xylanase
MIRFRPVAIAAAALAALSLCAQAQTTLKDAYKNIFYIGSAVSQAQFNEQDARGNPIIAAQFNTISPENVLKWESVHPRPDGYNFAQADRYVAFGEKNRMFIVGHNLVWHSQVPQWVFQDGKGAPVDRDELLLRMHDHIMTVVGRYKGRIQSWDVVNEALNEDGTLRQSPWMRIIGDDYIAKAFQYAHEADPQAELNYNDYNLENEAKRKGALDLVKKLKDQGIFITAVGLQGHDNLNWPTVEQQDATIAAFKALGVKVAITELDVDVLPAAGRQPTADVSATAAGTANSNPYAGGLPDAVQQALAKRYADLFGVYLKYRDTVTRVTFWGVTDGDSWKNDFPVRGRTNYPLLFDRAGKPKPAFDAVVQAARAAAAH